MARSLLTLVIATVVLGGCALTPEQEGMLERAPDTSSVLIGRSIVENGVVCRYSDGRVERHLNVAAPCL